MSLENIGQLFSKHRLGRAPELSRYTVDHSAIDEYIHDELVEKAGNFRSAIERCPEFDIEVTDPNTGATEIQRKRVDAAQGLNSDMFFGFHDRRDVPRVRPREEIKPSHEMFRDVMEAMIDHADFKTARAHTRGDEIASALAMMAAQEALDKELQTTLREQLEQAQDMKEQEDIIGSGPPQPLSEEPNERWEQLKDHAKKRREARGQLETLAQAQEAQAATNAAAAAQAVANIGEAAKDAAEGYANMPGNEPGVHSKMSPEKAIEVARNWLRHPDAARVAALMGRFERDFRFKRANRTVSGREIPVDVEVGNDLSRMLASEMVMMAMPETEILADLRFVTNQMLQYEMVGEAESGKGPIVILIDFSGSMQGERHIWAKAVSLSMLSIASRERRPVTVVAFDTRVLGSWTFVGTPNLEQALEFATMDPRGGTAPYPAMLHAQEIINGAPAFRQADIVIVTDGDCHMGEEDLELREQLKAKGVRIFGISIECRTTRYLEAICDHAIPVTDMQAPSEATDMLVQEVI